MPTIDLMERFGRVPTVVIADASEASRAALARLLARSGWNVVGTAADGIDALKEVRRNRPDVLLVDEHLGLIDATTLGELLQEHPHTQVVELTSDPRAHSSVFRHTVSKSASPRRIVEVVEAALGSVAP